MQNTNSKLNTILLIIVIILLAVGVYLLVNKKSSSPEYNEFNSVDQVQMNQIPETNNQTNANQPSTTSLSYTNEALGFSFVIPEKFGSVKTYNNGPLESSGDTGQSMRGYLSYSSPILYFAGMTPNYTAPRGIDCGEATNYQSAVSQYGEIVNAKGIRYAYANVTSNEMEGPHQAAYFKLNKGQFPVLGFCAVGMTQSDFKAFIDTVIID